MHAANCQFNSINSLSFIFNFYFLYLLFGMIKLDVYTLSYELSRFCCSSMEGMQLHSRHMYYLAVIFRFNMLYLIYCCLKNFKNNNVVSYKFLRHGQTIEIIWTMFSAVMLLVVGINHHILLIVRLLSRHVVTLLLLLL